MVIKPRALSYALPNPHHSSSRRHGFSTMFPSTKQLEYRFLYQGFAFAGEAASPLYPESNSSNVIGKRLIGIFAEPIVKWLSPSFQIASLSVSKYHVLAWSTIGTLYSWGINHNGIVGVKNNGKQLNELISSPTLVDMQLGENPGIVFGLATKEASIVINFRGRVYYWGK
jgi:hypothetical protein